VQMQPVVALELTMNRVFLVPTIISPATRVSLAVSDVKLASTAAWPEVFTQSMQVCGAIVHNRIGYLSSHACAGRR